MEDYLWAVSSRSHRSITTTASKYQSGSYRFEEEEEEEDEIAVDYPCPFCSDDYDDLIELCHHIGEEHQLEANHCICPVCSKRVKMHMVDHITTHHRHVLKSEHKQTSYMEDPYSSSDKYLHSLLHELPPSLNHHTSKNVVSDQFLSFINNGTKLVQPVSVVEDKNPLKDSSLEEKGERALSPLSDSEQLEKAKKSEFVKGLLSSAMFGDGCDFFFFF